MLKSTFNGLQRCCRQYQSVFIRLAVVAPKICEIPQNSPKIRSSSRSSKVIDLVVNRNLICNFLLVINSNYECISYRFRDIHTFSSKIACFSRNTIVWHPLVEDCPVISTYRTPLKSTFNRLQFHPCRYEIPTELQVIEGQGHPRSSVLVSIKSAYATSY